MRLLASIALFLISTLCSPGYGQQILTNASFDSGLTGWTTNPSYAITAATSYKGVTPAAGTRMLVIAGPANVSCTYARMVSQSRSAPFVTGVPADNFLVYLSAYVYVHTNDGRPVSYSLTLEPGYGQAGSSFHGGAQDTWVTAQSWGYYYAHDPFDASSAVKPMVVSLDLRDPLQTGEYILLDDVELTYGGAGIPEPSSALAILAGLACLIMRRGGGQV